jgi:hypothetical protein
LFFPNLWGMNGFSHLILTHTCVSSYGFHWLPSKYHVFSILPFISMQGESMLKIHSLCSLSQKLQVAIRKLLNEMGANIMKWSTPIYFVLSLFWNMFQVFWKKNSIYIYIC